MVFVAFPPASMDGGAAVWNTRLSRNIPNRRAYAALPIFPSARLFIKEMGQLNANGEAYTPQ